MEVKKIICCFLTILISASVLHAENKIHFVYYNDYAPFSWSEGGKIRGLYINVVDEIFINRLGISVVYEGYPWKRAQKMVRLGKADGYCTTITPERLTYSAATKEPVIEVNFRIYTTADNPRLDQLEKVKSIQELQGFNLVEYSGSGWAEKNLIL